ncbi:hypothetical protein AQUCO_00500044v1 [Aquilegia coerulea]|uniref:F-box domain-containing protein n=1 Tax=Aquilegia coerulea TaxID=218851 RepID=A0A2G5EQ44_AQUCA|nr:hypothetical protein AQUCO_00500044v1 [Aquilegia coerulea]
MATSYDMLPDDVVYHILLWLPVVSLLRFKSVCKAWCSLIGSSDFITQHLHLSNLRDNDKVIVLGPSQFDIRSEPCFSLNFLLLSGNNFQVSTTLDLPHRFDDRLSCHGDIISCNGIICQVHKFDSIVDPHDVSLWNPATKQFKLLPKSEVPLPQELGLVDLSYGFGFDILTNDYKVVRIISEGIGNTLKRRVEVYSLNMDSWRNIDVVLPVDINVVSDPKAPFRNGIYCWSGWDSFMENGLSINRNIILSFDFSKEVFGTMPVPDVCLNLQDCKLKLALLRENIACIEWVYHPPERENWNCKIWVLNEYGVKESWTKLYTIVLDSKAFPRLLSMNGMIIWIKNYQFTSESRLCLYNTITQELKSLPYDGTFPLYLQVANYKESLVSIESADCAIKRVSGAVNK